MGCVSNYFSVKNAELFELCFPYNSICDKDSGKFQLETTGLGNTPSLFEHQYRESIVFPVCHPDFEGDIVLDKSEFNEESGAKAIEKTLPNAVFQEPYVADYLVVDYGDPSVLSHHLAEGETAILVSNGYAEAISYRGEKTCVSLDNAIIREASIAFGVSMDMLQHSLNSPDSSIELCPDN